MRLLDTITLTLHEFFGDRTPPYAILSHTWGDDEVLLQDMATRDVELKAGYDKIRRCCEMAWADGFEYAWVDTCCIDKQSSSELSEAINSMFNWYRVSDVCYVYLADVPANLTPSELERAIRKSRWFTRGWTLQELIAPASIIFFDHEWDEIGTKKTLEPLIHDITRIHMKVLEDAKSLESCSVAQKMSWASKRETTRTEDIAYCLLGLFNVNIPMLYGEGSYAFIRLQEEIMRKTADHSIFAWTTENHYCNGLLAGSPAKFENSGSILQDVYADSNPFSMTNKGIHLNLPIKTISRSGVCLAMLDCFQEGAEERESIGIYLEKLNDTGMFRRIGGTNLESVRRTEVHKFEQQDMFVQQVRRLTDNVLFPSCVVFLGRLMQDGFQLVHYAPRGGDGLFYDEESATLTMSPKISVCAFRLIERTSQDSCMIFLKCKQRRESSYMGSLSATVIEYMSERDFSAAWKSFDRRFYDLGSFWSTETGLKIMDELEENNSKDRLWWRHSAGWSLRLSVKSGMVSHDRAKIVHISRHSTSKATTEPQHHIQPVLSEADREFHTPKFWDADGKARWLLKEDLELY